MKSRPHVFPSQERIPRGRTRHRKTRCVIYQVKWLAAAAAAKSLQSCPTLHDPIDGSPLDSPVPSPGKNTGVGCHFLLQCMKVKSESEVAQLCLTQ